MTLCCLVRDLHSQWDGDGCIWSNDEMMISVGGGGAQLAENPPLTCVIGVLMVASMKKTCLLWCYAV